MPGIAQVWLTQKELESLLLSAPETGRKVPAALWEQIEPKLAAARDSLGCPVPWSEELKERMGIGKPRSGGPPHGPNGVPL